jgi:hypothetical protein
MGPGRQPRRGLMKVWAMGFPSVWSPVEYRHPVQDSPACARPFWVRCVGLWTDRGARALAGTVSECGTGLITGAANAGDYRWWAGFWSLQRHFMRRNRRGGYREQADRAGRALYPVPALCHFKGWKMDQIAFTYEKGRVELTCGRYSFHRDQVPPEALLDAVNFLLTKLYQRLAKV